MSDGWSIDHSARAREAVLRNPWEWASAALIFLLLLFSSYLKSDVSKVAQPAVYDFLMAGTVALHVILRIRFPKELGWPVLLWLFLMLGYGLGALDALLPQRARDFMLVMSYLIVSFVFFAAMIYDDPRRRLPAIWWGYVGAALIASLTGIAAYFGLLASAEFYLRFGRVTSFFNDPNVYGAFLVAPTLFVACRLSLSTSLKDIMLLPVLGVLVLGIFLSFSRGAWGNLLLSGAVFMVLAFITSRSPVQRFRLILVTALAAGCGVAIITWALSAESVSDLFAQRFSLSQSYDVGEGGRFDRQINALQQGLTAPLGMGPAQWEEITGLAPHNVYLNILIAGGYLSFLSYLAFIGLTLVRGTKAALRQRSAYQPYLLVAVAALVGHAAESLIIDVDNWRHLFLIFGLCWGGIAIAAREAREEAGDWRLAAARPPVMADGFHA